MKSVEDFRADPAVAGQIIGKLLPEPSLRQSLLEHLAGSIATVHELNPASWELSLAQSRRYVRLNVGGIAVLDFRIDGTSRIALRDDGVDLTVSEGHDAGFAGDLRKRYKMLKGVGLYSLSTNKLVSSWPELNDRHQVALKEAAHQMKQTPWASFHSPGTVEYLGEALGNPVPQPEYSLESKDPIGRFPDLFAEFVDSYFRTEKGEKHRAAYKVMRDQGRKNYEKVLAAKARGEDVTDAVLTKLLPYHDSTYAHETQAWVHIAPVFRSDPRKKAKLVITDTEAWPNMARALLDFIAACNEEPADLHKHCSEFASGPHSKGFQSGSLSPILNALRPDDFLLINNKPREAINWLAQTKWRQTIAD